MDRNSILITGASGLIGTALTQSFLSDGHKVRVLGRKHRTIANVESFVWEEINEAINEVDVVIHLAGAGIADKLWTAQRKKTIINSRVQTLDRLYNACKNQNMRPRLVSASAIGWYGNRGDAVLTEKEDHGEGFLSTSTKEWEDAVVKFDDLDIKTTRIRIGVVLAQKGGALSKLIMPLKFNCEMALGSGAQILSWIHLVDLVGIFKHVVESDLSGIYNGVAPEPLSQKSFLNVAAKVLGKRTIKLSTPAFLLRLFMGEMASIVLDSTHVSSRKIENSGYHFSFPKLESAFTDLL